MYQRGRGEGSSPHVGPHLESLCFSPQLFCFFEAGPKAVRREKSGQLEKKKKQIQAQELWSTSVLREGTPRGNETEGWGEKEHRALEGEMEFTGPSCLLEPHRIRVVELKPHKSIQVVRGHP